MQTNDTNTTEQLLSHMANRAAARTYFLAGAIQAYQERHQLDRQALANWLGITPETLTLVELCGRPDPTEARYEQDIEAIASEFEFDPAKLETILAS